MNNNKKSPFINKFSSDLADDETLEMIPLLPTEEEDMSKDIVPDELAILPVKNTVLFPGVVIPITVGRQKSIKLIKKAYKGNRIIGVVAQANDTKDEPSSADLYKIGTVAHILQMLVLPRWEHYYNYKG